MLTAPLAPDPRRGLDVNVHGVLNTLDAAGFCGVRKVVLASSIAVYGDAVVDGADESTGFQHRTGAPRRTLDALSKLIGETLGELYAHRYGLGFAALRIPSVYDERQHERGVNALHILDAYRSVRAGRAPVLHGAGQDAHDFVYVGDVARPLRTGPGTSTRSPSRWEGPRRASRDGRAGCRGSGAPARHPAGRPRLGRRRCRGDRIVINHMSGTVEVTARGDHRGSSAVGMIRTARRNMRGHVEAVLR